MLFTYASIIVSAIYTMKVVTSRTRRTLFVDSMHAIHIVFDGYSGLVAVQKRRAYLHIHDCTTFADKDFPG